MTLGDLGERGLIERIRQRVGPPGPGVGLGIGDDAAWVSWPSGHLLLTTDSLLEDVHFRRATASLVDVGAKALAVNLSDIAAMGGTPRVALVALAAPRTLPVAAVDDLYTGLLEVARQHQVQVVGGDTCGSPGGIVLTITVAGDVDGAPLCRGGARPGDAILVTGTLGAAAAGLAALERGPGGVRAESLAAVYRAHRRPIPRIAEGRAVHGAGVATAMMDLSDGLATDLGQLARESGVGAVIHLAALPIAEATREVARGLGCDPTAWAVGGGEDYELLITVPAARAAELAMQVAAVTGTPLTRIGEIRPAADGIRFLDEAGRPARVPLGFDHFA